MPPPNLPEGALNPLTQVTEKGIRQDRPEVPLSFPMAGEQSLHPSSAGPGASLWRWGQGLIDAHPSCHPSHFPPVMKPSRFQRFRSIQRKFSIDLSFVKGF